MALQKKNRLLTKNFREIKKKSGLWGKKELLSIKIVKNNAPDKESRFGFVVGGNISKKATERNLVKRRMRAVIQKNLGIIKGGFDVIVIAHPGSQRAKYSEIEKNILEAVKKLNLFRI